MIYSGIWGSIPSLVNPESSGSLGQALNPTLPLCVTIRIDCIRVYVQVHRLSGLSVLLFFIGKGLDRTLSGFRLICTLRRDYT